MKKRVIKFLALVGIVLVFILINFGINSKRRKTTVYIDDNCSSYIFDIEDVKTENEKVLISGWCLEAANEITDCDVFALGLLDKNGKVCWGKADRKKRADVNAYFKKGNMYLNAGFESSFIEKEIRNEEVYQIIFKYNKNEYATIKTIYYLYNGNLYEYDPTLFITPNLEGTDMENVIKEGKLIFWRPEHDIYCYQKDMKLYFIAGQNFYFEEDRTTNIELHFTTSRNDLLPQERVSSGRTTDNVTEAFEKYEITDQFECGRYRVCVREIPNTYPITSALLGYINDGTWIWEEKCRLDYADLFKQ